MPDLLEIRGLKTAFHTDEGTLVAVDDVSFSIGEGKTLGVVGESGCGKSVTALSVLQLVPDPPGKIVAGEIRYRGEDLLEKSHEAMRRIRGKKISMIFQEPMTSLNPVFTVGEQIAEVVRLHEEANKKDAWARAVEMLKRVGIPAADQRARDYPHQLSGGMRQRVMIAIALACNPDLLIADEPTTALDVTIQAQILDLIRRLQEERGMAVMLITHDLGVVAETCDDVVVMYAGKVVEQGTVAQIFDQPTHPYTVGLLRSIPHFEADEGVTRERLPAIPGTVPSLLELPGGCRFRTRCDRALARCADAEPPLVAASGPGHLAACVNPYAAAGVEGGAASDTDDTDDTAATGTGS